MIGSCDITYVQRSSFYFLPRLNSRQLGVCKLLRCLGTVSVTVCHPLYIYLCVLILSVLFTHFVVTSIVFFSLYDLGIIILIL